MALRVSRRKLAAYYAERLVAGDSNIAKQLAAYLIDTRRTRELELIIRDIELALLDHGIAIATITSAHDLSATTQDAIRQYIGSQTQTDTVAIRNEIDTSVLAGVKVSLPDQQLDATARHTLNRLKASKI